MRKLLIIILLIPYFANAQVNGTIQKIPASGLIRGSFGTSGIDTLVRVQGLPGFTNGQILVWNNTLKKFVAGTATPDSTIYRTVANSFSKAEASTNFVNVSGDIMTGQLSLPTLRAGSSSYPVEGYNTGGAAKLVMGSDTINANLPKWNSYSSNRAGYTSTPPIFASLTGSESGVYIKSNNTQNWPADVTGHPTVTPFYGQMAVEPGATGTLPKASVFSGTMQSTTGFTITEANMLDITFGSGGSDITHANGARIADFGNVGPNGTGIYLVSGDNLGSPLGKWAIYDTTGLASNFKGDIYAKRFISKGQSSYTSARPLSSLDFMYKQKADSSYLPFSGGALTGSLSSTGSITGSSFIKSGGSSSQFLKADGSVDNSTYLTSGTAVTSITGTANQITASAPTGAVTLSLPQSIATTSSPTFANGTFTGNVVLANNKYFGIKNSTGSDRNVFLVDGSNNQFIGNLLLGTATIYGTTYNFPGGAASFTNSVSATSFIKSGGTSSQYLMADGSVSTGGGVQFGTTPQTGDIYINGSYIAQQTAGSYPYSQQSRLAFTNFASATNYAQLSSAGITFQRGSFQTTLSLNTPTTNNTLLLPNENGALMATSGQTSGTGSLTLDYSVRHYVFTGTTSTWTLPAISGGAWDEFYIKNRGSGTLTINTNGGANVIYNTSASNTISLAPGDAIILVNDGTFFNVE